MEPSATFRASSGADVEFRVSVVIADGVVDEGQHRAEDDVGRGQESGRKHVVDANRELPVEDVAALGHLPE